MTTALGLVLLVVGLVAALSVAIAMAVRRSVARRADEGARALDQLLARLGATRDDAAIPAFRGRYRKREFRVSQVEGVSTSPSSYAVHVQVAIAAPVALELLHQQSSLGASLVNEVAIGDPEFDKWFIVRTSDLEAAARALTPDLRAQFIEWLRRDWLHRVWTTDGTLHLQGRGNLVLKDAVERVEAYLDALATLAEGLER